MNTAIIFEIQTFLILLLLFVCFYFRKDKFKHIKIMKTAIAWDLLLVAQIELTRGAIKITATQVPEYKYLAIHLFFAISSVLMYFVILYTGTKLKNGNEKFRKFHKILGITCLSFRTMAAITSFWATAK